jgi:hypothetical protein
MPQEHDDSNTIESLRIDDLPRMLKPVSPSGVINPIASAVAKVSADHA